MEDQNGKTTVWVPKEAFSSVIRLWKPEFNWIPVPVDRSLPPDQIAYIETGDRPVSPLPPLPRTPRTPKTPKTPGLPLPRTPRTPLDLPPLETTLLSGPRQREAAGDGGSYFGGQGGDRSPEELETAITAGFSPGGDSERPDTPSTATEPDSPATPKDYTGLPKPSIWRASQVSSVGDAYQQQQEEEVARHVEPFNAIHGLQPGAPWKMVDQRDMYRPKDNLKAANWKTLQGQRDLQMKDHWQTFRRDEAHWNGSEKGFAVRLDMHLNVQVEMQGTMNGDITLSAEALYAL